MELDELEAINALVMGKLKVGIYSTITPEGYEEENKKIANNSEKG
jgi:hypothetical protein